MKRIIQYVIKCLFASLMLFACNSKGEKEEVSIQKESSSFLIVLGTLQDAGMPHIGCKKDCCAPYFAGEKQAGKVVSLGIIDPKSNRSWLFEASPDISQQLYALQKALSLVPEPVEGESSFLPSGIFLTHAHIGHYAGLMYLGREALGADSVRVFAMPRMGTFLRTNGPWSQLVELGNIELMKINEKELILLSNDIKVEAFRVPHRDEFSETVGYKISGPNKTALFIPDIDKWEKWDEDIIEEIKKVDYAFLDATFFSEDELPKRDLSEIPHPTVEESMKLFEVLSEKDKAKVYFIHFNHSNPLVDPESEEARRAEDSGFKIAREGMVIPM